MTKENLPVEISHTAFSSIKYKALKIILDHATWRTNSFSLRGVDLHEQT